MLQPIVFGIAHRTVYPVPSGYAGTPTDEIGIVYLFDNAEARGQPRSRITECNLDPSQRAVSLRNALLLRFDESARKSADGFLAVCAASGDDVNTGAFAELRKAMH